MRDAVDDDSLAVYADFPGIRFEHTRKHLDERAFPSAVLAHDCMDFAGLNRKVDAVDGADLKEGFAEVDGLKRRRRVGCDLRASAALT